ncbi:Transmembrane amino acid transporter family protein isoform 3 [Hibiscus syriacus]|uniref:Transmembrane amino acid transporter family protein isoform 3 n=1 Tax=Hibiscus syriacus TaxID=106335 RepID=A0A6A3B5C1_HIBSY|nr:Transmembrane amino acid transporter family protein isoform 3 [Hibiscus syriacus]
MKNSVSDQSFYIESEDEEEVEKLEHNRHGEEDANENDFYTYFSSDENLQQNKPSSHQTTQWPQSYRQSIDLYSSVPSPTIGFLGTPTLSRLGSSFLSSSLTRSSPELATYPDIGQKAFGAAGRITLSIILYVELYASCVDYIILEGDNLSSLFPNAHLTLGGFELNSHHLFCLMTTLSVLPTVMLRDLSVLSYISAGGVFASFLVVICLFWVGLVDQVGFHNSGTSLNLATLPVAVGLYGFCYSGHAVFPNIYTSMTEPAKFNSDPSKHIIMTRVFDVPCGFGICTLLYAGTAVMGYKMFGEATESQFTLNMPKDLVASKIAVWATVVNPFTKYALTLSPVAMSLEELLPSRHLKSHIYPILIRTLLVMSTLLVGLSVPFFGLVLSLIGSLLTMLVTLILPPACYLSILRGKVGRIQVRSYNKWTSMYRT